MPRMTVYVPETLWDNVKAIRPDLSPSQSFQDALREVVRRERARPEHAKLTPALVAARDEARREVLEQSTVAYQQGYAVGVRLARTLHWQAFAAFADSGWDWDKWRAFLDGDDCDIHLWANEEEIEGANPAEAGRIGFQTLDDAINEEREERGLPDVFGGAPGPVKDGLVDAIRDVWEGSPAAVDPETGDGSPAAEPANADEASEEERG